MKSRVGKYVGIPEAILSSVLAIGFTGYVFGFDSGIEKGKSSRDLEVFQLQETSKR